MSIMTVEMRGFGDLGADEAQLAANAAIARFRQQGVTRLPFAAGEAAGDVYGTEPSFLDQWGIPIAAGVGGLAIGLVIAKLARSRKRG